MTYTKIIIGADSRRQEGEVLYLPSLFDVEAADLQVLEGRQVWMEGPVAQGAVVTVRDNNFDLLAPAYPCLILGVQAAGKLAGYYPADYRALVVEGLPVQGPDNLTSPMPVSLRYLPLGQVADHAAVVLKPIERDAATRQFETLQHYMDQVMAKDLWLQSQTLESLLPYLHEEAQEYQEALQEGDRAHVIEELGDVLWEVLFQTSLAEYTGYFSLEEVLDSLNRKIRRRHPHVFDGVAVGSIADIEALWQSVKAKEKADAIR